MKKDLQTQTTKIKIGGRNDVIVAIINGKERPLYKLNDFNLFFSLKEFANLYKKDYENVIRMFNSGLSLSQILEEKEYDSINIATKSIAKTDETAKAEVPEKKGFDMARSLALTGIPHAGIECVFENTKYISLKQCAEAYNVKPQTIYSGRHKGYTLYECIYGKNKGKKKNGTINNEPVLEQYVVPKNNLSKTKVENKKDVETQKPFFFHGTTFNSNKELMYAYNVSERTFSNRKEKGYSLDECIFGKLDPSKKRTSCLYDGLWYPSLTSLCIHRELDYDTLVHDLRNGKTLCQSVQKQLA